MNDLVAPLVAYVGNVGLYSAIVGLAVALLMPERSGTRFGGVLAALGGIAMACELVAARFI